MPELDITLNAEVRDNTGTTVSAKVREAGKLPAVVYGPGLKENINVSVNYKEFEKAFKAGGKHHIIKLTAGKKTYEVLIKDFSIHPISRMFLHVDFMVIDPKKPFITEVPVNYLGTPVGVKEGGGLYVFARKVRICSDLKNMPSSVDVDISNLKISQYMIVRDIEKKSDYKILTHEGTTLVEVK